MEEDNLYEGDPDYLNWIPKLGDEFSYIPKGWVTKKRNCQGDKERL